jgi:hypothetical protein
MLPVGEVLPGVVVFLECVCLGRRGISPPDAGVLVIIEKLCAAHAGAEPQLRYLERWELVSPFTKAADPDDP